VNALHTGHSGSGIFESAVLLVVLVLAGGYLALAIRRASEPRGWSRWRSASFLTGCALLLLGLLPALSPFPTGDLRGHMHQHLLTSMYAPLGLVLGAPVTVVLGALKPSSAQRLGRLLRSRPAHLVANPVVALCLNLGALGALYFTPLYHAMTRSPALHAVLLVHFLLAGCLFAWVIAGPDPAPRRPSVPARLVVLGVAILGHAVLAQLIYAGAFVELGGVAADERRGAGDLMYYGGDIAELLLALALVSTWRPVRPRAKTRPLAVLRRQPTPN
jgi:putative membrane protein